MTDFTANELADFNDRLPPATHTYGGAIAGGNRREGWLEMTFQMRPEFCHALGLQGGFVAGMLDTTMARMLIVCSDETRRPPTLELKVSYLAPGGPGRYRVRADIDKLGKSVAFTRASLFDADETLIAKASATARLIPVEPETMREEAGAQSV